MSIAVKNDNRTPLTVPASVRRKAGFKTGQQLKFSASKGVITIVPTADEEPEYTREQRRTIELQLAVGLDDIKAGRVRGPFATHREFLESLHREAGKPRGRGKSAPASPAGFR